MHLVQALCTTTNITEADEVAAVVRFVASDEAAYISGAVIPVDGGISTHG